jgi:ABC-type transport system involved in multi-copper enzyme maturation permease subunit
MSATMLPYRSAVPTPARDSFAQLLRAELTKFRTVRGWIIGLLVGLLLIVGLGALTGANSVCSFQPNGSNSSEACPAPPTGPGGEWVSDGLYLVSQPLAGDGSITVRVTSLTGLYSTHGVGDGQNPTAGMTPGVQQWAKAGLIIKASTTSGAGFAVLCAWAAAALALAVFVLRRRDVSPRGIRNGPRWGRGPGPAGGGPPRPR